MLKPTTIYIPANENDGTPRIDVVQSFIKRMINRFHGATVQYVTGHDPYCQFEDGEAMAQVMVLTDDTLESKLCIYHDALTVCDIMGQNGVMVLWSDNKAQFVGDPADSAAGGPMGVTHSNDDIGSPSNDKHADLWRPQSEPRDEVIRREHDQRVEEHQEQNTPWPLPYGA